MTRRHVVMDNGTGYSKLGYSGNDEPQFIIPSAIAVRADNLRKPSRDKDSPLDDLDFHIGGDAIRESKNQSYSIQWPVRHGLVENWTSMEKYWSQCVYKYLRCDPEEHYFLLSEPPLNTPENRMYTAEVMFESFNVPGMYISVQAVLALAASWSAHRTVNPDNMMTGAVVDIGDGVTHVVPVADGFVVGSAIKHIPVAGRDVSFFIQQLIRERGLSVPPDESLDVATAVKESLCYTCSDLTKEFLKLDNSPESVVATWSRPAGHGVQPLKLDIGYERFLAPEIFFQPEYVSADYQIGLPELVDQTIQACPIDTRRSLYSNIVLSGGSTMFKNFGRRIERDTQALVNNRLSMSHAGHSPTGSPRPGVRVAVVSHKKQRHAVWYGGSILAAMPQFTSSCRTKAQYDENGPSICRTSNVITGVM